ncbi:MAG: hypothetical protein IJ877_02180 [Candidatus Gastranaerophilales bacterium]|nr:hypothetical protein [Candidatus Gastranaerophilales bacterium]
MKKILYFLFLILIFTGSVEAKLFDKKSNPVIFLTPYDPRAKISYDEKIEPVNVFRVGDRIYFSTYTKKGFKSDYIKYQIVKQEDNAHTGGYTRVMNKTVRVNNKNYYVDYFIINKAGKYFIQIFDITNLQQWIVMGAFAVVDE